MKKTPKRGLGRGIESLIPPSIEPEFDPTRDKDEAISRTQNVLISDIRPNPEQPRKEIRKQELSDLASSIMTHGILQPLVLVATDDGYLIVAGERRWRAAQLAGLEEVPAIVRSFDNQARLEIALIENIQREDLAPLELATAVIKLNQQFNQSIEDIASRLGKAHSTLNNTVRLLDLPLPAKRALADRRITEGHGRQILSLQGDDKRQQELLDLILKHGWSVRRAEQFVTDIKQGVQSKSKNSGALQQNEETQSAGKILKTDVFIQPMARGRGRIVITYKNEKDRKRLLGKISGEK